MDATVVIPARDAAATLPALVEALGALRTSAEHEVILVDDGSRDATAALARAAGMQVLTGAGEGPAAARNLGAAHARGRVLAFTDADCAPAPGWLEGLLAAGADLIQGRVLPPPDTSMGPYDRFIAVVSEYGLYETANLAVRRDLFERLGGFRSILRPRRGKELGEDVWLGWRARRAGASTCFAPDALVHHAVFPRTWTGYVAERARLRFFPELVGRIPELRDEFCFARAFLNRRTAAFDLALAGVALAALARSPLPLVATVPYARIAHTDAVAWPGSTGVAAAQVAADAVGLAALAAGSVRARSVLL